MNLSNSFTNDDYKAAEKTARQNLNEIAKRIPRNLAIREDNIFKDMQRLRESSLNKLEKLYHLMDDLLSFYSKYTPCHKGCSFCCYIEISISSLEATYIEQQTGTKQSLNTGIAEFFGTPCPFLMNDICSIYKWRPFVCRRHNALFDNTKWCNLDLCDKFIFPQLRFSEVDKSYQYIIQSSRSSLFDIRQVFKG